MDFVQAVIDIINQVGFPIACVVAMFWQVEKERESHAKESATWVEALNRNTNVMEKLLEKIDN